VDSSVAVERTRSGNKIAARYGVGTGTVQRIKAEER
jgi:hypothetical protein